MTDNSLDPAGASMDSDKCVYADVDNLSIDGTNPEVGDRVEVKTGGNITDIHNGVAKIKVDSVNGLPMPSYVPPADLDTNPTEALRQMAVQADAGSY